MKEVARSPDEHAYGGEHEKEAPNVVGSLEGPLAAHAKKHV